MSKKEEYRKKIEAEVELVQAKLAEWKASIKSTAAGARIKYAKQIPNRAGSVTPCPAPSAICPKRIGAGHQRQYDWFSFWKTSQRLCG